MRRVELRGESRRVRCVIARAVRGAHPRNEALDGWREDRTDESGLRKVIQDDRIIECFHLTGPVDFRIRAVVSGSRADWASPNVPAS